MKLIKIIIYRVWGIAPKDGSLDGYIHSLERGENYRSPLSLHMENTTKTYERH